MDEGRVVGWYRKAGEHVVAGEPLLDIETDKTTISVEAPITGRLSELQVAVGETAAVGTLLVEILSEESGTEGARAEIDTKVASDTAANVRPALPGASAPATEDERHGERRLSSPAARRLARAAHVNLAHIRGTGPGGRIVAADIESAVTRSAEQTSSTPDATARHSASEASLRVRKMIAAEVTASHQEIPSFSMSRWIDLEPVMAHMESVRHRYRLSDYFLCATAYALTQVAELRMVWSKERNQPEELRDLSFGLVVSTDHGVVIPIIKGFSGIGLADCSRKREAAVQAARQGRLDASLMGSAAVSVSLLTREDADEFNAIIRPGQSAIVAAGRLRETPVARAGKIEVRRGCTVTLTLDHRVVDGRVGANFLGTLTRAMEETSFPP